MARDDRLRGRSREGRLADEQLVQHAGKAVLVTASIDLRRARGLLRAHVGRGTDDRTRLGQRLGAALVECSRDAKVGDHGRATRQQDILWLDVPMHDPVAVGVTECARHLYDDAEGVLLRELLLTTEAIAQRLSLHERHDVVQKTLRLPRVVKGQDMRMLQPRGDFDFARKAFRADLRRELWVDDFNRDLAVVFYILGAKHGGHAPAPQLAVHSVGVSERLA